MAVVAAKSMGGVQAVSGTRREVLSTVSRMVDPTVLILAGALLVLGLIMVASASIGIADRETGRPLHYFWRQAAFVFSGLAAGWATLYIPTSLWRRMSPVILLLGIALLALVLVPGLGREVNGSTRWLMLGSLRFQPSEFVKLGLILYLSGYLLRRHSEVREALAGFLKPLLILGLVAVLLLAEPDFGTTVVVFATALGMLFLGGVPWFSFFAWVGAVVVASVAVLAAAPYRVQRLTSFLDPWSDPFDKGFQLTQALIAIGRGEWFGVGLGGSVQKLYYLPEAHNDFLFAVLGEELGFAGMFAVVALFTLLVRRIFLIARSAELSGNGFGAFAAYGIAISIGLQAFINIGVNTGVLPTKGLALPLMSAGGSSVVVNIVSIGLVMRTAVEARSIR